MAETAADIAIVSLKDRSLKVKVADGFRCPITHLSSGIQQRTSANRSWELAMDGVVFASSAKPAQNALIALQVALTSLKQGEEGHFEVKPGNGAVRRPAANGMQLLRTEMLSAVLV